MQPHASQHQPNHATSRARRHPRVPWIFPVHLKTPELRTHDEAFNVSEGGMAIATTNPLPVQTLVGLTVELPHAVLSVELVARVVWSTRDAMGLRFESVGAELLDGVERLRRDLDRL